jgi:hypothetical protein
LAAEEFNLQRFRQPFSILSLLGECESDLEPLPHLIYGEISDALRNLDAGRLRRSLHTTTRQEDRCHNLREKN